MSVYYSDGSVTLHHGDCLDVLATLPDESVDAVVTDPPAGISFMSKTWDHDKGGRKQWVDWMASVMSECCRILKPGGHAVVWALPRTSHWTAWAIEDGGLVIRDCIVHLFGTGFPKSLAVDKAIDQAAGVERGEGEPRMRLGDKKPYAYNAVDDGGAIIGERGPRILTAPATDAARQWQGWGTSLKPASEHWWSAQKPFNPVPFDWRLVTTVHHALAGLLWLSLSPAKRAEFSSPSSPAEHADQPWCASARVTAALASSPDASAKTDTFNSPAAGSTSSSIAWSWNAILGALSDPTNTSTTSTRSSLTTGLKILSSLLAPLTSLTTMPHCGCLLDGASAPASTAGNSSSDEWSRWIHSLDTSAAATATAQTMPAVASALASIAESLSSDPGAASSAEPTVTTASATSTGSGTGALTNASSKSASEHWWLARKPLVGTVAGNVQAFGTGALNIDACRIGHSGDIANAKGGGQGAGYDAHNHAGRIYSDGLGGIVAEPHAAGRWPANVVLDEHQAAALDRQSGESNGSGTVKQSGVRAPRERPVYEGGALGITARHSPDDYGDTGGASRFFYVAHRDFDCCKEGTSCLNSPVPTAESSAETTTPNNSGGGSPSTESPPTVPIDALTSRFYYTAKASSDERPRIPTAGGGSGRVTYLGGKVRQCNVCETRAIESGAGEPSCGHGDYRWAEPTTVTTDTVSHPTVKPLSLMRWLVRLVTPPVNSEGKPGVILDCFAGSGTTIEAAILERFRCIAIEREAEYLPLCMARIHRRRDPVAALRLSAPDDLGLFGDHDGDGAA